MSLLKMSLSADDWGGILLSLRVAAVAVASACPWPCCSYALTRLSPPARVALEGDRAAAPRPAAGGHGFALLLLFGREGWTSDSR